jgi:DNA primase
MRLRDLINRKKRENMLALNEFAKNVFARNLTETDEGVAIGYNYLKERGFNEDTIKTFELGFGLTDRKALTNFALKNGYRQKYLADTGLSIFYEDYQFFDRFCNCVIFPVHNLKGKVIGFCGRILTKNTKGVFIKYIDSPHSEIFDKHHNLYGIYQAKASIASNDKCFIVEGPTDVLTMHQSGIENVVAIFGLTLTVEQIRLISKITKNITLLLDGDTGGIHAALRGIDTFLSEDMDVRVVLLPDGDDPDTFARSHSTTEIEKYIAKNETDFVVFKTRLLLDYAGDDTIDKANAINDVVESIAVVPNGIKRELYTKECAELTGIDEKVLNNEIDKRRKS